MKCKFMGWRLNAPPKRWNKQCIRNPIKSDSSNEKTTRSRRNKLKSDSSHRSSDIVNRTEKTHWKIYLWALRKEHCCVLRRRKEGIREKHHFSITIRMRIYIRVKRSTCSHRRHHVCCKYFSIVARKIFFFVQILLLSGATHPAASRAVESAI